ncbi:MAG TPA: hypothetical protein VMV92_31820 [Streptosporangiaceae bacterium]|nr:hypothetical protein [Streptosporangiaceae bacterium]
MADPSGPLKGIAVDSSPRAEYAVTAVTVALGAAKATKRVP